MTSEVEAKIEKFFAQYRVRHYPKGQVLLLNGEDADNVYNLVSGTVKQYDVSYRGDEVILNVFKPPAFFPMSLAINKVPNPYIYEADSDVEIRQAPADAAVDFLQANPDVLFDLLSRVYKGADGLLGRMARLMSGSAKSRLIYELIVEAKRFGKQCDDGSVLLTLNEKDLGARAGLSRETVNREASKLKRDKLLEIRKKDMLIANLPELEKQLGHEL